MTQMKNLLADLCASTSPARWVLYVVALLLVVGLLLTWCSRSIDQQGAEVSKILRIGMLRADVAASLDVAGAKELQGAYIPSDPTGLEDAEQWDLEDGGLLEIDHARVSTSEDLTVTRLSVCLDPSEPVGLRVWEDVSVLDI